MTPDAGEDSEVARPITLSVGIVPEVHRHRWQRTRDHQLADLADDRLPVRVVGLDLGAERRALQLAGAHRQERARLEERGAHIGAAAHAADWHGSSERVDDPAESLW